MIHRGAELMNDHLIAQIARDAAQMSVGAFQPLDDLGMASVDLSLVHDSPIPWRGYFQAHTSGSWPRQNLVNICDINRVPS